MKRLRLIGMQAERGALLKLLQHMGCVEIDEPTEFRDDPVWDSLTRPDTQALGRAREQRSELETLQARAAQTEADTQAARLLHSVIEEMMELACPFC